MVVLKSISVHEYLKLGGLLENIDWNNSRCEYSNSPEYGKEVVRYEDRGEKNSAGDRLLYFTFRNGKTKRFSPMWITIRVEFILNTTYTTKK